MKKSSQKKRVSKAEWLALALDVLAREGVQGVRVERLARDLGIAKAGFYWHFADRPDLLQQVLDYWAHEYTAVISENPQILELAPDQRLLRTMEMILEHDLAKYDLAIRGWAAHDVDAAKAVRHVDQMRLEHTGAIFRELGFRGRQLEMRTRLFVTCQSCELIMFRDLPREQRRRLLRLQHKLFLTK